MIIVTSTISWGVKIIHDGGDLASQLIWDKSENYQNSLSLLGCLTWLLTRGDSPSLGKAFLKPFYEDCGLERSGYFPASPHPLWQLQDHKTTTWQERKSRYRGQGERGNCVSKRAYVRLRRWKIKTVTCAASTCADMWLPLMFTLKIKRQKVFRNILDFTGHDKNKQR